MCLGLGGGSALSVNVQGATFCQKKKKNRPDWNLTLVVEAVDAVDGGTLVVAPEQEEVLWVFDLVRQQQADGLQRLFPSVHVVAQEQVVCLRGEAAILEEPQQVCVLSVDVTWDGWRRGSDASGGGRSHNEEVHSNEAQQDQRGEGGH